MDNETNVLTFIEDKINYNFNNRDLLERAFTHKSYNPEDNNEILEFIGDKILNAIIATHLFENYKIDEGILTKLTSYFVDNKSILPKVCIKHSLDEKINISDYENNNKNSRENWIPSLLEALIGAVFIDCGKDWRKTEKVVLTLYGKELILDDKKINDILIKCDPVSSLKEYCDNNGYILKVYEERVGGFDHAPEYVGYVSIDGKEYCGDVVAGKKQKARVQVCKKVLYILR